MNKNDVIKMKPSAYKSMLLKKFKLNKEQKNKQKHWFGGKTKNGLT